MILKKFKFIVKYDDGNSRKGFLFEDGLDTFFKDLAYQINKVDLTFLQITEIKK